MAVLHTNNATTLLAGNISLSATSMSVTGGTGLLFPNPSSPDYFMLTLVDSSNNIEIVKCTARTTDTLTIVRGQEGTTQRAWLAGVKVENRTTAGALANKLDKDTGGTVGGPVTVTGAVAATTLASTGAATVGTTLGVTGLATLGSLSVTGNSTLTGNATVGGTTTLNGAATINNTLTVTGAVAASAGVTGNLTGNVTGNVAGNQSGGTVSPTNFVGAIVGFAMNTAPSGWLECNGSAVSRSGYAALFAAIGTTFGAGDGSTTFNLPDTRGYFLRGWDHSAGVDTGRTFGTTQTDAMQGHYHSPLSPTTTFHGDGSGSGRPTGSGSNFTAATTGAAVTDGTNGTPRTAAETRPKNLAILYCIKT